MITSKFIRAGRAVFTIENNSGNHYTFKVSFPKKEKDNPHRPYFVSILTGGDEYTYIGMLTINDTIRSTAKSKMKEGSQPFRVFNFAMRVINERQPLPYGYNIRHEGSCGKCGRPLTEPLSLTTGLGPVCRQSL